VPCSIFSAIPEPRPPTKLACFCTLYPLTQNVKPDHHNRKQKQRPIISDWWERIGNIHVSLNARLFITTSNRSSHLPDSGSRYFYECTV
jgi:hypothetical protein